MNRYRIVITLFAVLLPVSVWALPGEPTGFGKAQFGMSVDDVRSHFPELKPLDKNLGAAVLQTPVTPFYISRYVLSNQTVPGLATPTTVELRFWKGKLYVVIVYFGENDTAAAAKALRDQLGPPTGGDAEFPMWTGEKVRVKERPRNRYYGISDNALSQEAEQWFVELLSGKWTPEPGMMGTPGKTAVTTGPGMPATPLPPP